MTVISNTLLFGLLGLASLSSARPSERDDQNWEIYTNSLNYTSVRFRPDMGPGSENYARRFKRNPETSWLDNPLVKRQENRLTEPFAGENRIAYGCDTDIGGTLLSKLYETCDETRCDEGTPMVQDVTYPKGGREADALVTLTVSGQYPSGMRNDLIAALKAQTITEAVEIEEVRSSVPGLGHAAARAFACNVPHASNYMSVVVRDGNTNALIGDMNVQLTFETGDGVMCGTIGKAATAILGAMHAIGAAGFGVIQEIICSSSG